MSHRPLSDERWYTTPALCRVLHTYPAAVTDATLRLYISILSKRIDLITSQTFWPSYEVVEVRGKGSNSVQHPNRLPIILLNSVSHDPSRNKTDAGSLNDVPYFGITSGWYPLSSAYYKISDRSVFYTNLYYTQGFINFLLDGIFGWTENSRGRVQSTLAAELDDGDTSITIATGHGPRFKVRDIIDIWGPVTTPATTPIRAIIEAITGDVLTIDINTDVTHAPIGSVVDTYGQFPSPLELVIAKWAGILLAGGGIGTGSFIPSGALKKEQTDSYMWERFEPSSTSITGEITGDPFLDGILMSYMSPPYVGYV